VFSERAERGVSYSPSPCTLSPLNVHVALASRRTRDGAGRVVHRGVAYRGVYSGVYTGNVHRKRRITVILAVLRTTER